MNENVFIAIYTHECKKYCDKEFFGTLLNSEIDNAQISIVDNSPTLDYYNSLKKIIPELNKNNLKKIMISHIDVERKNDGFQFQRNVTKSLEFLQKQFITITDVWKYFIILESDVIPLRQDWISCFLECVNKADIIGGIYYYGFHDGEWFTHTERTWKLVPTHHVLSGCSLYKREILKKFQFRWSMENSGAFPDAWMSYDAGREYRLANYTKIKCDHLGGMSRGHENID